MSAPAYKINDRRSSSGFVNNTNTLYDASVQSIDRPRRPQVDRDDRQNLSVFGWREMMSAARHLRANFPPIGAAIEQMAMYSIGVGFNMQSLSKNSAWAEQAEEIIYEWDRVGNMKGPNFFMQETLKLAIKTIITDGDFNQILTEGSDGYPMIQNIPSHRIGSRLNTGINIVEGGAYDGMTIINGIIQDDTGRAIAARVYSTSYNSTDFVEYSMVNSGEYTSDFLLYFRPNNVEDSRGLTWLKAIINDALDIADIRKWLLLVVKGESSVMLQEYNETGSPSNAQRDALLGRTDLSSPQSASNPNYEMLDGGTIRYFKMGKAKLESLNSSRPSVNAMEFQREILRGAFSSLGWPIELYDPEHVGGAPSRQRLAQAIKTIEDIQCIAERIATDAHRYVLAKAIKNGQLDPDPDWYKMYHQRPRSLTVDNGYDIKGDLEMMRSGMVTQQWVCDKYGEYWEEVQEQKVKEEANWQRLCEENDVEPDNVRMIYPNPVPEPADGADPATETTPMPKGKTQPEND